MRRLLLICASSALAVGVLAGLASAQSGVNISFNDCGTFGAESKTFACAANTGTNTMVVSVASPQQLPNYLGGAGVIDVITNSGTLPDWWRFDAGACRPTSLTTSFDFTTFSNCADFFAGQASGGISAYQVGDGQSSVPGPNRARIKWTVAIPSGLVGASALEANVETYVVSIRFNNANSTGGTACAGCATQACLVLNEVSLEQRAQDVPQRVNVTNQLNRNYVLWQTTVPPVDPSFNCGLVPARNTTWGQIKGLYR